MAFWTTKPHETAKPNLGPEVGTFNVLEVTLGQRGEGKSSWQCHRARELVRLASGQAFVIGHSLGARLPKSLPAELGGGTLPIEYHRSIESLDKGLHARPANWHIFAPPLRLIMTAKQRSELVQQTCDDLIKYSAHLSQALRDRAYDREHPLEMKTAAARDYDGIKCPVVIVIVDEGIAIESAGKGDDKSSRDKRDWFLEWIYSLRHFHTALLYAIQNPSARNWHLLSEATAVYLFRIRHQWALNEAQAAGASRAEIKLVRKFPKGSHRMLEVGADPTLQDDYEDELEAQDADDDQDDAELATDAAVDGVAEGAAVVVAT